MNEDFYINLIYKKLSDEISPSELESLEKWVQSSETNQQVFEDVKTVWDISEDLPMNVDLEVDLNQEFSALEQRIQKEEKQKVSPPMKVVKGEPQMGAGKKQTVRAIEEPEEKKGFRFKRLLAVAASVLLISVLGLLFLNNNDQSNQIAQTIKTISNDGTDGQEYTLPDLSVVYLNEKSSVDYPEPFGEKDRRVTLKGEAFFKVAHNSSKPFVIETMAEEITVLGTSFYVKAHEESIISTVEVVTGKVEVKTKKTKDKLILQAGERAAYNRETREFKKTQKEGTNEFAWHSKNLQFVETPISKVLKDIETCYNVNVSAENKELNKCLFTSNFEKAELSTVLETISAVLGVEVEKVDQGNYVLKGGTCQ